MAQKVTVQLVDDVDGSVAESTVEFGLDGVNYTVDLSSDNSAKLRDALAPYVANARKLGGRKRATKPAKAGKSTSSSAPTAADRERNQAIREWAREQGMQVSDRGRIPAEIVEAYDKAS